MRIAPTKQFNNRVKLAVGIHLLLGLWWLTVAQLSLMDTGSLYWCGFVLFFPQVMTSYIVGSLAGDGYDEASFAGLFLGLLSAFPISYLYAVGIAKIYGRVISRTPKNPQTHNVPA